MSQNVSVWLVEARCVAWHRVAWLRVEGGGVYYAGQDRPKMSPRRPKMSPRWVQEGPKWAQEGPRWAQDGPKMAPRWAQDGLKIALRRPSHIKPRKKSVPVKASPGLGPVFGPSWGPYTGLYGPLTPSYRLIEGILRRKARKSKHEGCP